MNNTIISPLKSKNIIILLPFFTLGGAETQALHIVKGFKSAGHQVTVVAFGKKNGKLIKVLDDLGIAWELAPFDLSLVHQKGIKKFIELFKFGLFLRKLKPTFLFPFTYYPNILTSAVWRITGAVSCYWNQRGLEQVPLNFIEKLALKAKPKYLSNSIAGAQFVAKKHGLNIGRVQVIPNGINPSKPINNELYWRDKLNVEKGEKLFVQVANFYPEKNHLYIIKAWHHFMQDNPSLKVRLLFIGYAPNNQHINAAKALVFDLKLTNVQFEESTNDVSGLLQIADVGLLASSSEGCPNIVLEYMYAKVKTVVSKIPATVEIFGNDYPLFCDLNDELTLVKTLHKIVEYSDDELVSQNYELVQQKYAIERLQSSYNSLVNLH